jgi:serine phosphatase RsbU (regulator of sigma subunit)
LEHLNGWFDTIVSTGQFFTASYVVFNHRTGRLWVASAGHPPPMLVGSDGSVRELSTSGIPIGVQPGYSFRQQEVAFQAGDLLYLYSDGLIEAVQGDRRQQEQVDQGDTARFFGRQRLADLLGSLSSLGLDAGLGQVRNSIAQWSAPFEADDDRTIIAFGRRT